MENYTRIHQLFEAQASQTPDAIAVSHRDEQLTYQELNERAARLAKTILAGSPESALVGICNERSINMIVSVLAILKAGKAYLPLDKNLPVARLQQIAEDSAITCCISGKEHSDLYASCGITVIDWDSEHEADGSDAVSIPSSVAYVLYTSGSTGVPKGVCMGHDALINLILWQKKNSIAGEGTKTLQFAPLGFDVSFQEIFATLSTGGTLEIIDDTLTIDPQALLNHIRANGINRIYLPFVALQYLTEAAVSNNNFPDCIQEVITAGEQLKITPQVVRFFSAIPGAVLYNQYGPTECHVVSQLKLNGDAALWPFLPSIGTAIDNTVLHVLDEQLNPLPEGTEGELCISGICLAEGYLNRAALTAEKFCEATINGTNTKIYRTGDIAKLLPGGEVEFLGRRDDQVKISGYRIEIGEIEVMLSRQPGVKNAVVTAREYIAGQKRLVAYLVPTTTERPTAEIKQAAENELPEYMVPAAFVWMDELPKTASGKVDRKALPAPDRSRPELAVIYKAPVTETERKLAEVWSALLLINKPGVNDNFFDLGGSSLLAVKLVAELKNKHNLDLPVTKLYQYPTIAGMARCLDNINTQTNNSYKANKPENTEVAIIGMAGRFPGADTIDAFWEILKDGRETVSFFTDEEIDRYIPDATKNDPNYIKARGVVTNADAFDASFFGMTPRHAELTDPQQRLFLEIAWEVLEQTGHLPSKYNGQIGVYAGVGNNTYYTNNLLSNRDMIATAGAFQVMTQNEKDYVASRVAFAFDLKGPAVSVHSACSTSLLAVCQAVQAIRQGQCEAAIAGAASVTVPIKSGHIYQEGAIFSKDGHCRPFDVEATGTVFSDGAAVVLLKDRAAAERDGDTIYAMIRGIGVNNDGGAKGNFSAPSTEGQAGAISAAIADANVTANDITYIEAHGTATPLGDPIEIEGLKLAFGPAAKAQQCAIGSVKSNLGHLTATAGVAGLIKTVLAMHHKKLPASINYSKPNPHITINETPFYVNTELRDWKDERRIAGISSFGVGGTNVHVIIESYENPEKISGPSRDRQVICWSAKSEASCRMYGDALAAYVQKNKNASLADIAYTLRHTRDDFNYRKYVTASNTEELIAKLSQQNKVANKPIALKAAINDVVFMFPGQGAQYAGMGKALYNAEPVYRNAVDECAAVLQQEMGEDIQDVLFDTTDNEASAARIKNTYYTQPGLFVTEYALAKLYMSWGIKPSIFIGHSIGEFVAAHLAGVFSLSDALRLISSRGRLMAGLEPGSMLAVLASHQQVAELLPGDLSLAAVNSPGLSVVAGKRDTVEAFSKRLAENNINSKLLQTSHAFHSAMMDPVVAPFKEIVNTIKLHVPNTPIVSTVTGTWIQASDATDPGYWANHLRATVRFSDGITTLLEKENMLLLECGPGNVTATLAKQHPAKSNIAIIHGISGPDATEYDSLMDALGRVWSNGITPDWNAFYNDEHRVKIKLPTYQFDRKKCWVDPAITVAIAGAEPKININTTTEPARENEHSEPVTRKVAALLELITGTRITQDLADATFIELGFDSLLLAQIALKVNKEFNANVAFRQLNESYNTTAKLAAHLKSLQPEETSEQVAGPDMHQTVLPDDVKAELQRFVDTYTSPNADEGQALQSKIEKSFDVIEPQQEIWLSCQIGGDDANRAYNQSVSLTLDAPINIDALQTAVNHLYERHEALRAIFDEDGSTGHILKAKEPRYALRDISSLGSLTQAYLDEFTKLDAAAVFDLANGPLFRAASFKLSDEKYCIVLTAHHIICDGWSLGILMQDISKLYTAFATGKEPSLEPAPSFSNYATFQATFSQGEEYKTNEQYWLQQYKDNTPILDVPTSMPRPAKRTYSGRRDDFPLNGELVRAVRQLSTQQGASIATTLISAFEIFLHKITGQEQIVLGLPAAGHLATDNYHMVGHCVSLLPLLSKHESNTPFTKYLQTRKLYMYGAYEHQLYTFSSLLKKLNIPRDSSRIPLVPVVFNVDIGMDEHVSFYNARHKWFYNKREFESFELFVNVAGNMDTLTLEWSYNTQLYTPERIADMMKAFSEILTAVTANKEVLTSELPVISFAAATPKKTTADQQSVVPTTDIPVYQLISQCCRANAQKEAVVFEQTRLTYEELDKRSNKLANYLVQHGVKKQDIVALAIDRSEKTLLSLLAIMKAGAVYLPIDLDYPDHRIQFVLKDSNAKFALTQQKFKGRFHPSSELYWEDVETQLPTLNAEAPKVDVTGDDLVYVLYTSGSTGNPKGVQIKHSGLTNFLLSMREEPGINANDKLLAITTISFDIAGLELYLPLISGAQVIITSQRTAKDGSLLLELMKKEAITLMQATPSTWRMILEAGWNVPLPVKVLSGGEPLPQNLATDLLRVCLSLWNMYGPTETTVWSTIDHVTDPTRITIGKPIRKTSIYLLDETLREVPHGEPGEIYIGGDGVANGYLNRPDLTAQRFVNDPFSRSPAKMYKTGDLGKWNADGTISYVGRADNQVKVRGHRIELEEIEHCLTKVNGIKEAIVTVHDNNLLGYVTTQPTADISGWRQQMKENLPAYMVPYDLIIIDKFQLTPNGKIDRKALPEPTVKRASNVKTHVSPRTNAEILVANVWEDLLHVTDISVKDDFFELGGHSLIGIQVMNRIHKQTGKKLPLASLFEAPTVEQLAKLIGEDAQAVAPTSKLVVPIKPEGNKTPLYIVHGYGLNVLAFTGLARNMDADQPVYGVQAIGLDGISEPSDKLEDIAAQYVAEIIQKNKGAELALAGYSFGGTIALEMARQLREKGKKVTMVAMFDSYNDSGCLVDTQRRKWTTKLINQIPKLGFIIKSLATYPVDTVKYQAHIMSLKLRESLKRPPKVIHEHEHLYNERILQKYNAAFDNYITPVYDGVIDVFQVTKRVYYLQDLKFMGWKSVAKHGVNIHKVPGDHKTFLMSPYDKEFARILQQRLDEAAKQAAQRS